MYITLYEKKGFKYQARNICTKGDLDRIMKASNFARTEAGLKVIVYFGIRSKLIKRTLDEYSKGVCTALDDKSYTVGEKVEEQNTSASLPLALKELAEKMMSDGFCLNEKAKNRLDKLVELCDSLRDGFSSAKVGQIWNKNRAQEVSLLMPDNDGRVVRCVVLLPLECYYSEEIIKFLCPENEELERFDNNSEVYCHPTFIEFILCDKDVTKKYNNTIIYEYKIIEEKSLNETNVFKDIKDHYTDMGISEVFELLFDVNKWFNHIFDDPKRPHDKSGYLKVFSQRPNETSDIMTEIPEKNKEINGGERGYVEDGGEQIGVKDNRTDTLNLYDNEGENKSANRNKKEKDKKEYEPGE